ncbi:hypothetical protein [Nocardia sp. AG03]|uniref:hypothetical protein n=1 Tax=Nocardia sp. AG03 TaxID=3025312 RepID=UPI002418148D|nr:hypothetical protein [Nocardia sp. AG03]
MTINDTSPSGLWQAACDGRFRLEADAAQECAAHYAWLADQLEQRIADAGRLNKLSGFGGFDSAQALQRGFEGKADQGVAALQSVQRECWELQAAVLRAGGALDETDLASATRILSKRSEVAS